ncbi:MAG: 3'-5' exonuclease [Polyangiaceae bacterium]
MALRDAEGRARVIEAAGEGDEAEAELLHRLVEAVAEIDPDVIENHNLHGFDLPFLVRRARSLGVPLRLGRTEDATIRQRPAARGAAMLGDASTPGGGPPPAGAGARARFTVPGRELIDTLDAVLRHDFSARDLPGHGLKAVARHFGLAREGRETVPGGRVYEVYCRDPERVRRYAEDDVHEAAGVARLLGGAAFALARMAPRRYERLADAGPATGVLEPMLVRAYLRAGAALPAHEGGDGTSTAGLLFTCSRRGWPTDREGGRGQSVSVPDAGSTDYPEPRQARERCWRWWSSSWSSGWKPRAARRGCRRALRRFTEEAMSAAMKIVVNSAYGYLGAVGLTRFSDVHAANEVTRHGRELLGLICGQLAARGVTLLQADTDGVLSPCPRAGRRPTRGAPSPRWPVCCLPSSASNSTAGSTRCCRTSPRTTP